MSLAGDALVPHSDTAAADAPATCRPTTCQGELRACGDCLDNDRDGLVDMADLQCLSPCDDSEDSIGAQPRLADEWDGCRRDCGFDGNGTPADDECQWSLACDAHYDGRSCLAPPVASCDAQRSAQPANCSARCLPVTPNGCDCFGCCELSHGSGRFAFINEESCKGDGTSCRSCTPVPSCFNTCDACELCIGRRSLDAPCGVPKCATGVAGCDAVSGTGCAVGSYCLLGCCVP